MSDRHAPACSPADSCSAGSKPDRCAPSKSDMQLRQLMQGYQRGEAAAFEELYALISGEVYSFLALLCGNRERAEDLLQESFLQMHRSRHTYDAARPFRPWAYAIARHVFRMEARSWDRRQWHESRFPAVDWRPPAEIEKVARRDEIENALWRLPVERREAIVLHHAVGLSFAEIGAILGKRAGTVKVAVHRALQGLRKILEDETRD